MAYELYLPLLIGTPQEPLNPLNPLNQLTPILLVLFAVCYFISVSLVWYIFSALLNFTQLYLILCDVNVPNNANKTLIKAVKISYWLLSDSSSSAIR